jgi:hypothetical protein
MFVRGEKPKKQVILVMAEVLEALFDLMGL